MMASFFIKRWAFLGFLLLFMSCTGTGTVEDGGGTGGTGSPVVASGSVTGFGSIFVTGIEFDISDATITLNGKSASDADLQLGQVVTVHGTLDAGGTAGTAQTVAVEKHAEGPIDSIDFTDNSMVVLGQIVQIDDATQFGTTPFDTLEAGDIVALSGFVDADGVLQATRIDKTHDDFTPDIEIEATGIIAALDGDNQTFMLNQLQVDFSTADLLNIPGGQLQDGQFVRVTSSQNVDRGVLFAARVEARDVGIQGDPGQAAELQGIITEGRSADDTFKINGQPVRITPDTVFEVGSADNIAVNVEVEVEGVFGTDGIIVVESVELGAGIELRGLITRGLSDDNTFEVDGQPVQITPDTAYEGVLADSLKEDALVEVEGFFRPEGVLVATEIGFLLQSTITRAISPDDTFEVNGQLVQVTPDTEFKGGTRASLVVDALVEIEGFSQDGVFVATEIEFLPAA